MAAGSDVTISSDLSTLSDRYKWHTATDRTVPKKLYKDALKDPLLDQDSTLAANRHGASTTDP